MNILYDNFNCTPDNLVKDCEDKIYLIYNLYYNANAKFITSRR